MPQIKYIIFFPASCVSAGPHIRISQSDSANLFTKVNPPSGKNMCQQVVHANMFNSTLISSQLISYIHLLTSNVLIILKVILSVLK